MNELWCDDHIILIVKLIVCFYKQLWIRFDAFIPLIPLLFIKVGNLGRKPKTLPFSVAFYKFYFMHLTRHLKCHMIMKLCWNQSRKTITLFHNQWDQLHMHRFSVPFVVQFFLFADGILFLGAFRMYSNLKMQRRKLEKSHIF